MNGLMILDNNFEDTEAILVRDILIRAKNKVDTLSLNKTNTLITKLGLKVKTDLSIDSFSKTNNLYNYDFIILPGGPFIFELLNNYQKLDFVINILKNYHEQNKVIGAICAAPLILDKAGILPKKYTIFPCLDKNLKIKSTNKNIEETTNIITAKSLTHALEFAICIVNKLNGKQAVLKLKEEIAY